MILVIEGKGGRCWVGGGWILEVFEIRFWGELVGSCAVFFFVGEVFVYY